MKIVILGLDKKRKTGLETWKDNLIHEFSKENNVEEIYTLNGGNSLRKLPMVLTADICHSYSQSTLTMFFMFLRKLFDKKNIHTVHGNYYEEQLNKKGLKKIFWIPFNKICAKLADKLTFPSNYLYQEIIKREPEIKNKSIVIPNGINIKKIKLIEGYSKKRLGLQKSDFSIVEVTNFNLKQKAMGIDLLIKDFKKFNKKEDNSYLFIIGGGRLLTEYKNNYESKNIKFLGFRNDTLKYIKSCDLFAHYSYLDSFGYVILEGLACNKPVVAKGSKVFNEILSITPKLTNLNKRLVKQLKKKQSSIIFSYDIKKTSLKFINLYKSILKNNPKK